MYINTEHSVKFKIEDDDTDIRDVLIIGYNNGQYICIDHMRHETIVINASDIIESHQKITSNDFKILCNDYKEEYKEEWKSILKVVLKNIIYKSLFVYEGPNALTTDDHLLVMDILDIDQTKFKFKIGETYLTQDNQSVKVIGRTLITNYECLVCSDGKYRYDRSSDSSTSPDKGRCTGSSGELFCPHNFLNEKYGNRYELSKEFCEKYNYLEEELKEIGKQWPLRKLDKQYIDFLKSKNMETVYVK